MQPSCAFLRRWRSTALARPEPLAWFALAGVVAYVGIDVLLAVLRPRYSLLYDAESDYGRGPWYWLMDVNFLLRCALSLALAGALARSALARSAPARARGGLGLLVTWAVCSGLLAFFADDPEGQPATASGRIHLVLAFIAFTCMAVGAIVISVGFRSGLPAAALPLSIAAAAAYLLLGVAARHRHAPVVWPSGSSSGSSCCGSPWSRPASRSDGPPRSRHERQHRGRGSRNAADVHRRRQRVRVGRDDLDVGQADGQVRRVGRQLVPHGGGGPGQRAGRAPAWCPTTRCRSLSTSPGRVW